MDLFADPTPPNLLPRDGDSRYVEALLGQREADDFYTRLHQEIDWQRDRVKLYGRDILTKRAVAWHGDAPYRYTCLLYTSPSPRDAHESRMPSSA